MLKTLLIAVAMSPFLSCSSCSDNGNKGVLPPGPVTDVYAWAEWSPDGQQIAVCWGGIPTAHDRGIYLVDTAGWVTQPILIDNASNFSSMSWSPTGEWLLFARNAQIYKMKPNGDSLTQLTFTSRQWDCDWSDSDTLIVYRISTGDSSGMWIMREDGSQKRSLVRHGSSPAFARGDSILFIGYTDAPSKRAHLAILSVVDSSTRTVHSWIVGQPYHFYYSPRTIMGGDVVVWSIERQIWTINLNGTNLKQLTIDYGKYPNWSPTGDRITYFKPTSEGGSLWIMNADGSGQTPVPGW